MEEEVGKTRKYDRQLRLWEKSGQNKLENAHILVLGCTATSTEALKDLVLPGVGEFTLVDDQLISPESLAVNFFLEEGEIGQPIAQCVTSHLVEMNDEVVGHSEVSSVSEFISQQTDESWDTYSLVIISSALPSCVVAVAEKLFDKLIPVIELNVLGFYGMIRISLKQHEIIQTHPESIVDLRIDCPWPELTQLVEEKYSDFDAMDSREHSNIPYVVILIKALESWKKNHNGKAPSNIQEKNAFRSYIQSLQKNYSEVNFTEAVSNAYRAFQSSCLPDSVVHIMEETSIESLKKFDEISQDSSGSAELHSYKFWVMINALKLFTQLPGYTGSYPLSGAMPDMASDTSNYISLQRIYREKAKKDADVFESKVRAVLSQLGAPENLISREEIETFCKNVRHIKVQKGSPEVLSSNLFSGIESKHDLTAVYLCFHVCRLFKEEHKRIPGSSTEDIELLKSTAASVLQSYGKSLPEYFDDFLAEFIRYKGLEIHNTAALMGGIGSQEAVKLLTKQYIPLNNLLVFDGVYSTSGKWKI